MAMTTKGIQYFSLDVNFFEDDRIAVIISDYGFEAVAVTLKLFSQIYKNGFYMKWNEKTCKVFTASFRSSFSSEMIDHLVHDLVKELVFEPSLFEKHQILTSKAIQRNYFEAVCRRKNFDVENVEYLLVEIPKSKMNRKNVDKNVENADKNTKNADIFQQRKEKESKEKKSKEDMDTSCCAHQGETKYGFPDLCRRYRAELERDEDWLFAVSQLSGLGGAEIVRRIAGAMDIFETHIVSTGETGSILHINDYKRRFQYWWRCMGFESKENLLARSRTPTVHRADPSPKTRSEQLDAMREEAKKALMKIENLKNKTD